MLTRKQHELLMFIHERIRETGVSPSFDEMKAALQAWNERPPPISKPHSSARTAAAGEHATRSRPRAVRP